MIDRQLLFEKKYSCFVINYHLTLFEINETGFRIFLRFRKLCCINILRSHIYLNVGTLVFFQLPLKVSKTNPLRYSTEIKVLKPFSDIIQFKLKSPINSNTNQKSSRTKISIFDNSFDDGIRCVYESRRVMLYRSFFSAVNVRSIYNTS